MLALVADRKQIAKQFPNVVDYESKQAFRHFYDGAPLPPDGAPVKDYVIKKGFLGSKRVETTRPFRRSGPLSRSRHQSIAAVFPAGVLMYHAWRGEFRVPTRIGRTAKYSPVCPHRRDSQPRQRAFRSSSASRAAFPSRSSGGMAIAIGMRSGGFYHRPGWPQEQ